MKLKLFAVITLMFCSITKHFAQCSPPSAGNASQCAGQQFTLQATTFSASIPASFSHRWYTSASGGSLVSGITQNLVSSNVYVSSFTGTSSVSVSYYVAAVCNGVESSSRTQVTYTASSPSTVAITPSSSPSSVCNSNFTLTASGTSSFTWYLGDPDVAGYVSLGSATSIHPTTSGTYFLKGLPSTCSNGVFQKKSIPVTLAPIMTVSNITGPSSGCQGGTTKFTCNTTNASYQWSIINAGTSTVNTSGVVVWDEAFYGNATVQLSATGCTGTQNQTIVKTLPFTMQPRPVDGTITASATTICLGSSVTISATGGVGEYRYWCTTDGGTNVIFQNTYAGQSSFSFAPPGVGTYRFFLRNMTACGFCSDPGNNGCPTSPYVDVTVINSSAGTTKSVATGQVTNTVYSNNFGATMLTGQMGNVLEWQYSLSAANGPYTSWGQAGVLVTSNTCCLGAPGQTIWIRAKVQSGGCSSLYSTPTSYTWQSTPPIANNYNYIKETTLLKEVGDIDITLPPDLPIGDKNVATTYFDGIGRPIQSVITQGSPTKNDIIQPIVYDPYGREALKYLPYTSGTDGAYKPNFLFKEDASYNTSVNPQYQFYQTSPKVATDAKPYAETRFEGSPLNRTLEQGSPGAAWQPDGNDSYTSTDRTIKTAFEFNVANEVIMWSYFPPDNLFPNGMVSPGVLSSPTYYAPNQLYKNRTKDEELNEVIEYVDKDGMTILKKVQLSATQWAQTYYIYNDKNQLVMVLQPEAVKAILGN